MKRIIMDIDETICTTQNGDYRNAKPIIEVVDKIKQYKSLGFEICFSTSRNMRTYEGNAGKIRSDLPYRRYAFGKTRRQQGHRRRSEGYRVDRYL